MQRTREMTSAGAGEMHSGRLRLRAAVVMFCLCILIPSGPAEPLDPIRLADDRKGFVTSASKQRFVPWGFNYAPQNVLLEDDWPESWPVIESDFQEMKTLGANVVRVHLQVGHFMTSPDNPSTTALAELKKLLQVAEKTNLYLDVTGLGCYRPSDVPPWFDQMDEEARWAVQARFWEAIAETCKSSSAVFCYNLINEPISPAEPRGPGRWMSGTLFGGFDFVQFIALDPAGRRREDVATAWIRRMTKAIRKIDGQHMITVGLLPWEKEWGHLSGFLPEAVAPDLDFLSVHYYPKSGAVDEALEGLRKFAVGKPVVLEETFSLYCSNAELETFLSKSQEVAPGMIGHYFGNPPEELERFQKEKRDAPSRDFMLPYLRLFERMVPRR